MGRLVYSSEGGRACPGCGAPVDACTCGNASQAPTGDGVIRIRRETKGRKGKAVTVVTGVPLAGGDLKDLAKRLKQLCGSGGTVRDGDIEIQGDHRDRIVGELAKKGWTVKRSGG
ncbi:translation initiation factor Sui1 [bacterium]|nr:translation initiation factor Sui1 [bacterium]